MAKKKSKNRIELENKLGMLSELEWTFIDYGFHAIARKPEWLENQNSAILYFQDLLIGFRSMTTREQVKLVDSVAYTIDGKFIYIEPDKYDEENYYG